MEGAAHVIYQHWFITVLLILSVGMAIQIGRAK